MRRVKGRHGRIGRIIEWYVTVLCRFARNVGAVSELMAAGQMFRGFSAELSCPRAQHNARDPPCESRHVHTYACIPRVYERRDRIRVHAPPAKSASGNVYITCTVTVAHSATNTGIMQRNMSVFTRNSQNTRSPVWHDAMY